MDKRLRKRLGLQAIAIGFATVVLCAQAMALVHQLDFDAHSSGHVCEICLVGSVLGNGNVAAGTAVPAIESPLLIAVEPDELIARPAASHYRARAPPRAS